ncbi:uncharacterized protein CIMG_13250 [Coccidioides immitis RS]|uniref:Uncharacterized protein n=1 Tax=Coccidioides immitis (strain RS) TaxID=246410 RepID=A0A0D8JUK7_COCIM|nr:uncharacterized protein CIMG_13250 [Coccidioides immitis RS]KJF60809.1 hypothetical protein CIMG_13250 [Coccidioides immitis RS]
MALDHNLDLQLIFMDQVLDSCGSREIKTGASRCILMPVWTSDWIAAISIQPPKAYKHATHILADIATGTVPQESTGKEQGTNSTMIKALMDSMKTYVNKTQNQATSTEMASDRPITNPLLFGISAFSLKLFFSTFNRSREAPLHILILSFIGCIRIL